MTLDFCHWSGADVLKMTRHGLLCTYNRPSPNHFLSPSRHNCNLEVEGYNSRIAFKNKEISLGLYLSSRLSMLNAEHWEAQIVYHRIIVEKPLGL